MSKIHVMDTTLANQIAAGEVIERPASVVKELVENSLDAHAKVITIRVLQAGRTLISVEDDGEGMDRVDAKTAFLRHATSKIFDEFDLFRIKTLGFRGEALASIAAISHILMTTSDGQGVGTCIEVTGDEMKISDAPLRKGTLIEVSELFYNTPARLKYLKSDYTEVAVIVDVVSRLALAHTAVSFTLIIDDKLRLKTSGRDSLHETIMNIFGVFTAKHLIEYRIVTPDFKVHGYLGKGELARSNRYGIITNLNGRNVYMPKVQTAIINSYHDFLPDTRYPFVVLDLEIEPGLVDVNVHPSKREVRFSKENELTDLLLRSIPQSLLDQDLVFDPNPEKYQQVEVVARPFVEQTSLEFNQHEDEKQMTAPTNLFFLDSAEPLEETKVLKEDIDKKHHITPVAQ
jgi:DNA mismatch repair protein MutL